MRNRWTYYAYILITWFWTSFFFRVKLVEMIFTLSDIVISEDIREIHKYSREKMESLIELLRNFTSQIVFWFERDSRREKNVREIGRSRKIVRIIDELNLFEAEGKTYRDTIRVREYIENREIWERERIEFESFWVK